MAIDVNNSRFLLAAAKAGVNFKRTLTLGRLGLFVPPSMLRDFFTEYGLKPSGEPEFFEAQKHPFCEGFFLQLGAQEVSSVDFSDYEGATFIHDMNTPVAASFHNRFDVVVDGGTLEHVFNFPVGIHNAMSMVREGGYLLLDLPANNCCGHGFYQFSPELFWRLFQPEFGFNIEKVWMAEDVPFSRFYEARDPAEIRRRTMLVNSAPVHVFIQACRVGAVNSPTAWTRFPAQADYTNYWATNTNPTMGDVTARTGLKAVLQSIARRVAARWYWRLSVRRNAARDQANQCLTNLDIYNPVIGKSQNKRTLSP